MKIIRRLIRLFAVVFFVAGCNLTFAQQLSDVMEGSWAEPGNSIIRFNRVGIYAAGGRGYYAPLRTWQDDLFFADELRTGIVRFNSDVWDQLEPKEGQYNWEKLEQIVSLIQKNKMQVLFTLPLSNKWNSSHPQAIEKEISIFLKGKEYKTKVQLAHHHFPVRVEKLASIDRFAGALAAQFKGRIKYYELWNEPDFARYWGGKPNAAEYVAYCRRAYQAIKKADPDAMIVMGGLAFPEEPAWFDEFLKLGGGLYFDHINIHIYPAHSNLLSALNNVRGVMKKYGLSKKIWITEINSTGGYYDSNDREKEERNQSAYLAKNITMALAEPDVEKIIFYLRDPGRDVGMKKDFDLGVIRNVQGGVETKPAFPVLQGLFAVLFNAMPNGKVTNEQLEIYSFFRSYDRKIVLVLWSKSGTANYKLPEPVTLFQTHNAKINEKTNEIEVTDRPIILITNP
jgi:GH35 family endo-1,4-beta-xylanase